MNKEFPVLYDLKEECCGCTACASICPKNAIAMKEDSEGFKYPVLKRELCMRCQKCVDVCPIKFR